MMAKARDIDFTYQGIVYLDYSVYKRQSIQVMYSLTGFIYLMLIQDTKILYLAVVLLLSKHKMEVGGVFVLRCDFDCLTLEKRADAESGKIALDLHKKVTFILLLKMFHQEVSFHSINHVGKKKETSFPNGRYPVLEELPSCGCYTHTRSMGASSKKTFSSLSWLVGHK